MELDDLLDQALAEAELEVGLPLCFVAARNPGAVVSVDLEVTAKRSIRLPWSEWEEQFILDNFSRYTDEEIGIALGRTTAAVDIRRTRHMGLTGVSRHPDFVTAHQIARSLGVDGHSAVRLFTRGILRGWNRGQRAFRLMTKTAFYQWAVQPDNWLYFWRSVEDTSRMGDTHLRRLIDLKKARWDDAWWTPSQVAEWHGVDHTDVNRYLHHGKLSGVKWGNWWVKKSEAQRPGLYFLKGRGVAATADWSEEGDLFLLRAREKGIQFKVIARMMKQDQRRLENRYRVLHRTGQAEQVLEKF